MRHQCPLRRVAISLRKVQMFNKLQELMLKGSKKFYEARLEDHLEELQGIDTAIEQLEERRTRVLSAIEYCENRLA